MPSPFPGMDPYLEDPYIVPDFHHRLASGLSRALNARLPGPHYARVEMRPEVGIIDEEDEPTRPGEMPRHAFVEIRDSKRGHKLITVIEILSPSNKSRGPDRLAYEAKQREVLESDASLIEIDLLRSGRRVLPNAHLEEGIRVLRCPYVVLVSRAWDRDNLSLGDIVFRIGQRDPLPCIPVPLKQGEAELPLDLQFIMNDVYDAGPYRRGAVDYAGPIQPPLSGEDAEWAAGLIGAP